MRPCFAFNAATDTEATLSIYDEIGFWGVQAKDFRDQLSAVKAKVINVEINSPGGDVSAGLAIYNMLRASGKEVVTKVMGVAASAASLIFMAGDRRVMPKNTFTMVHNPWTFAMGNADDLRKTADTLDTIGGALLHTYASRSGLPEEEVKAMLSTDTWLTADESLEKGFATEIIEEIEAKASFDMDRADLPENVKLVFKAALKPKAEVVEPEPTPEPTPEPEVTPEAEQVAALAKAAGFEPYASQWAVAGLSVDAVKARIAEAREIKALAVVANKPEKADGAIKAGKSVSEFRTELAAAMAAEDEATHTNGTRPSENVPQAKAGSEGKPPVSSKSIWASHSKNLTAQAAK